MGERDVDHSPSSRDLPPLHEVLGENFFRCSRESYQHGTSDSLRSKGSNHGHSNIGLQLAPITRARSPQPRGLTPSPSPSLGANTSSLRLRPIYSSTDPADPHPPAQATAAHSYDLFDYSPAQGLVHKRSAKSQGDLDESKSRPRTTSVDDSLRKYVCSECGKRFAKPSTLRNHTLTHTGEKPFACPHPDCGRRFSMASNMHRHMRVHISGSAFQVVPSGEEEFSSYKHSADD